MSKVLFVYTKRTSVSAEYIRIKYFMNSLEETGITVLRRETESSTLYKYASYLSTTLPLLLRENTRLDQVELVITTVPPVLNAIISYEIALKHSKPLVIDIRDIWEEYVKTSSRYRYLRFFINKILEKYYSALKYADLITVTTDKMLKYYREIIDNDKIHVVPNGVDLMEIKCSGLEEKEYDLVYLADFSYPYHALEVLVNAIKNTDLKLLVIGGGKYLERVKRHIVRNNIAINVEYTGFIQHSELPKYLCRAKIGVSGRPFINNPEYLYTIPVKIYEYLGAGLPVLAYGPPNSAVEEFLSKHQVGYYISEIEYKMILDKINELVSKHREFFSKCISIAKAFDRRVLAIDFAKLITKLLNKSN